MKTNRVLRQSGWTANQAFDPRYANVQLCIVLFFPPYTAFTLPHYIFCFRFASFVSAAHLLFCFSLRVWNSISSTNPIFQLGQISEPSFAQIWRPQIKTVLISLQWATFAGQNKYHWWPDIGMGHRATGRWNWRYTHCTATSATTDSLVAGIRQ